MTPNGKRTLTLAEVSEESGLSLATIYKLVQTGAVPGAFKAGDKWILSRENFEKWINGESTSNKACSSL